MSKIAHEADSSRRKVASSTIRSHVHVCAMSNDPPPSPPWHARLYPYADAATYDRTAARRAALQHALKIEDTTAQKNRELITRICSISNITPTQLAKAASLSPSTINRFLKQTDSSANLSASTLASILEAAELLIVKGVYAQPNDNNPKRVAEETDLLYENVRPFRIVQDVTVIGCIESGMFRPEEFVQYKSEMFFDVKVPVKTPVGEAPTFALEYYTHFPTENFDNSDIVFCIPLSRLDLELSDGDRVVLNRRSSNMKIETSLRDILFDKKGGCWLTAVGGEADKLPPIYLGKKPVKVHTEELSLSFLVVGHYHSAW